MKKNGFTLVELIAVIVIIALLTTIAVPNIINISIRIKKNMYCEKIANIEKAAVLYGQDMYDVEDLYDQEKTPSLKELLTYGYLKKDNDNCEVVNDESDCLQDPRDNSSMDKAKVKIFVKNKRIYASYLYNSHNGESEDICN